MITKTWKKDLKSMQTKLMNPNMGPNWAVLKARIHAFMRATARTWGPTLFMLLERGIAICEKEQALLQEMQGKQNDEIKNKGVK